MLRGGDEAAHEKPPIIAAARPGWRRIGRAAQARRQWLRQNAPGPSLQCQPGRRVPREETAPARGGAPEPSSWDASRPSWVGWARRAISACTGQRSDARCGDLQYVAGDCRWFKAKSATAAVVREGALRRPRRPPIGDVRIRTGRPTVNYDGRRRFRGWPAGRAGHDMSDGDHRAGPLRTRSRRQAIRTRRRDRAATVWVCRGREIMTGGGRRHKDEGPDPHQERSQSQPGGRQELEVRLLPPIQPEARSHVPGNVGRCGAA